MDRARYLRCLKGTGSWKKKFPKRKAAARLTATSHKSNDDGTTPGNPLQGAAMK
jgi:hypothetical protein